MYDAAERMADAVYHHRTRLGMSQRELGERAHVSRHTIVDIEGGRTAGIRMSTLSKVFDALGLEMHLYPKRIEPPEEDEEARVLHERFRKRFSAGGDKDYALFKARSRG